MFTPSLHLCNTYETFPVTHSITSVKTMMCGDLSMKNCDHMNVTMTWPNHTVSNNLQVELVLDSVAQNTKVIFY